MTDEEKANALKEMQNRIMAVEADIKKYKGADMDVMRGIAKETIKGLEDEIACLKSALTSKTPEKNRGGFFEMFGFGGDNE